VCSGKKVECLIGIFLEKAAYPQGFASIRANTAFKHETRYQNLLAQ
jgi:hypothetical protein